MIAKIKNSYKQKREQELMKGTRYALRTEFRGDCESILSLLKPWLLSWMEASGWDTDDSYVDKSGRHWTSKSWGMDTDVEFIIKEKGPVLNEIRWLISTVTDCHVPAQTVALIDDFTGERVHYGISDEISIQPSKKMIQAAVESLEVLKDIKKSAADDNRMTIERLKAHLGDKEPYMRRVANSAAESLIEYVLDKKVKVDPVKFADVLYQKMTFDKSGAHINFP